MSYLWTFLSVCLFLIVSSCVTPTAATGDSNTHKGYDIAWSGRLQTVHRDGDSSPVINLRDIKGREGLFAIGPLAGLRGEITVVDGTAYIARVVDGSLTVSRDLDVEAPFLVYGSVRNWKATDIPDDVITIKGLEQWLDNAAKEAGIDPETDAFPFKIATSSSDIDYHVISNTEPGYHVSRPHDELKIPFKSHSEQVTILGVFSKSGAGGRRRRKYFGSSGFGGTRAGRGSLPAW